MQNKNKNKIALTASLFLHVLILFIHFQQPAAKRAHVYSIEFSPVKTTTTAKKTKSLPPKTEPIAMDRTVQTTKGDIPTNLETKPKTAIKPPETIDIDIRSIYNTTDPDPKKNTEVQLDMEGWSWDSVPLPNDTTNEVGKIIFKITIDASGFVVGIKEKEKNISPQLSTLYKESLTNLTFSKTSENDLDKPFTNGQVTFIIHSK